MEPREKPYPKKCWGFHFQSKLRQNTDHLVESELVESRGHGMIAKKVRKGVKASETNTSQNQDAATEDIV